MTNYEKNKELLDMYAVADISWAVNKEGKVCDCMEIFNTDCTNCIFNGKGGCKKGRLKWLQEKYKEPEIDWTKVEVDTPILVKAGKDYDWMERYFAGCIGGKVCAFNNGKKSEDFVDITPWEYAKLAESE